MYRRRAVAIRRHDVLGFPESPRIVGCHRITRRLSGMDQRRIREEGYSTVGEPVGKVAATFIRHDRAVTAQVGADPPPTGGVIAEGRVRTGRHILVFVVMCPHVMSHLMNMGVVGGCLLDPRHAERVLGLAPRRGEQPSPAAHIIQQGEQCHEIGAIGIAPGMDLVHRAVGIRRTTLLPGEATQIDAGVAAFDVCHLRGVNQAQRDQCGAVVQRELCMFHRLSDDQIDSALLGGPFAGCGSINDHDVDLGGVIGAQRRFLIFNLVIHRDRVIHRRGQHRFAFQNSGAGLAQIEQVVGLRLGDIRDGIVQPHFRHNNVGQALAVAARDREMSVRPIHDSASNGLGSQPIHRYSVHRRG